MCGGGWKNCHKLRLTCCLHTDVPDASADDALLVQILRQPQKSARPSNRQQQQQHAVTLHKLTNDDAQQSSVPELVLFTNYPQLPSLAPVALLNVFLLGWCRTPAQSAPRHCRCNRLFSMLLPPVASSQPVAAHWPDVETVDRAWLAMDGFLRELTSNQVDSWVDISLALSSRTSRMHWQTARQHSRACALCDAPSFVLRRSRPDRKMFGQPVRHHVVPANRCGADPECKLRAGDAWVAVCSLGGGSAGASVGRGF